MGIPRYFTDVRYPGGQEASITSVSALADRGHQLIGRAISRSGEITQSIAMDMYKVKTQADIAEGRTMYEVMRRKYYEDQSNAEPEAWISLWDEYAENLYGELNELDFTPVAKQELQQIVQSRAGREAIHIKADATRETERKTRLRFENSAFTSASQGDKESFDDAIDGLRSLGIYSDAYLKEMADRLWAMGQGPRDRQKETFWFSLLTSGDYTKEEALKLVETLTYEQIGDRKEELRISIRNVFELQEKQEKERKENAEKDLIRLSWKGELTSEKIDAANLDSTATRQLYEDLKNQHRFAEVDDFDTRRSIENITNAYGQGLENLSEVESLLRQNKTNLTETTFNKLVSDLDRATDTAWSYHRQSGWNTLKDMIYTGISALGVRVPAPGSTEDEQYNRARTLWENEVNQQATAGKFYDPSERYARCRLIATQLRSEAEMIPLGEAIKGQMQGKRGSIPPLIKDESRSQSIEKQVEWLRQRGVGETELTTYRNLLSNLPEPVLSPALDPIVTQEENSRKLKADEKEWLSIHLAEIEDIWFDLTDAEKRSVIDTVLKNPTTQDIGKRIHAHLSKK